MTTFALTECCTMLAIDPKTLRQWLRQAHFPLQVHPTDARLKCLSWEQVQQLATMHDRPVPSPASAPPAHPVAAVAQLQPKLPTPVDPPSDAAQGKTASRSSSAFLAATDLIEKLTCLETQVATMQQHLTHLALELLQERELRYERRLQALEALVQPQGDQAASPSLPLTRGEQIRQEEGLANARRLQPAERRARSRLIPLIEYGASGSYVVICPELGELHLMPDSPAWFDWLATLSSFRFLGQQGRLSTYRKPGRTFCWFAYRRIHRRRYEHALGPTSQLTIDHLEQMAAQLQSSLVSL